MKHSKVHPLSSEKSINYRTVTRSLPREPDTDAGNCISEHQYVLILEELKCHYYSVKTKQSETPEKVQCIKVSVVL